MSGSALPLYCSLNGTSSSMTSERYRQSAAAADVPVQTLRRASCFLYESASYGNCLYVLLMSHVCRVKLPVLSPDFEQ